jgi:hypothetical protein
MPTTRGLKNGSCLLAVVLCGALSTQISLAQETGSGASPDHHADSHRSLAAPPDVPNNSEPAAADDKKPDDIDTRITVQPHRPGKKPGKVEEVKSKIKSPIVNLHRRTFSTSLRAGRNAVGAPLSQREMPMRPHGEHSLSPIAPRFPVAAGAGVTGNRAASVAKSGPPLGVANYLHAGSAGIGRGAVGGNGSVHRNVGAAFLGGPATAIAGINGTSVRSKH